VQRILLLASLTLNVFLATALAQHFLFHPHGPRQDAENFFREIILPGLPQADRAIFAHELDARDSALRQDSEVIDAALRQLQSVVGTEPFDPAKFAAALDQGQAARQGLDRDITRVIADAVPQMSAEGRHRFAETMKPPGESGPPGPPGPREP